MTISQAVRQFKYKLIKGALEMNDGNVARTARMLGTSRSNLVRWVAVLGLSDCVKQTRVDRIKATLKKTQRRIDGAKSLADLVMQRILRLRAQGCAYRMIGSHVGLSEGAIATRICRAKAKIRVAHESNL